ncbi:GNAT family N-acetyltransferase [Zobellia russellii]|uniref:GNAT family N-acetyltransferase n=1 Tax=Zobellia russellii TaxID=248907 RepID=UPI001BFF07DF|nr:GNAT family N-acetyltransferase [Zobellia russellii]MBT9188094.1 GNAT family N-acetyltransferase [Zobellia russellii]
MVVYRYAMLEDALAIAQLHTKSWQENYRGVFSDNYLDELALSDRQKVWRDRLGTPSLDQKVIMAEKDGVMLGFACVFLNQDNTYGALLDNLHVSAETQGLGIGRHLMARVADEVEKSTSDKGVYLWVLEGNKLAQGFYDSRGGKRLETVEGNDIGDTPIMKVRYHWSSLEKLKVPQQ